MDRRTLLKLIGLAGVSAAVPSLGSGRALAGPSAIPKRIVFFYTQHGSWRPSWAPSAPGAPDPLSISSPWSTTQHTLGELHTPLVGFRDRLLFVDGLDMRSASVDPIAGANGHINGETHALTGANRKAADLAGAPSIDQVIAKALNSPTPQTSLSSLEIAVNRDSADYGVGGNYSGPGQPVPLLGVSGEVYDRLLPNGPAANTADQKAQLAKRLAQDKVVLEAARARYSALGARASTVDRNRMDAHASALSDLQGRLSLGSNAACAQLDRSVVAGALTGNYYEADPINYSINADIMFRLTQMALACDLTRVITLNVDVPPNEDIGYRSVDGTTDFHDMIHRVNFAASQTGSLVNNASAMEIFKRFHVAYATRFAQLLSLLDAIPEPDGGTLLDHTAVVWCGQIAAGDHTLDRIPYVIGGRMGGELSSGRYLRTPRTKDSGGSDVGLAHNDLFVGLANRMGVNLSTFGNAAVCKGALAGLSS